MVELHAGNWLYGAKKPGRQLYCVNLSAVAIAIAAEALYSISAGRICRWLLRFRGCWKNVGFVDVVFFDLKKMIEGAVDAVVFTKLDFNGCHGHITGIGRGVAVEDAMASRGVWWCLTDRQESGTAQ